MAEWAPRRTRETVVNCESNLPSTAKLYSVRFGPWAISKAGSRNVWMLAPFRPPFLWWCDIGPSSFLGAFGLSGLAAQPPVEDEQVVEPTTAVPLRPAKKQDVDAQP